MTEEAAMVDSILFKYRKFINETPEILSLLYDVDLLPEQIVTVRGAISVAAICTAYQLGKGMYTDA